LGVKSFLTKKKVPDIHFVIGMVKDKEVSKVLSLFPQKAKYYFTNAHIPRAMEGADLMEAAAGYGLKGECFDDVNVAIKMARKMAGKDDLIIVCGSVYLIGEVNTNLKTNE
jgi:dihydrofolate synthase/folylpolyglutamate synthase